MQYAFLWLLQYKLFTTELVHANSANNVAVPARVLYFLIIVRTFVVHPKKLAGVATGAIATAQFINFEQFSG